MTRSQPSPETIAPGLEPLRSRTGPCKDSAHEHRSRTALERETVRLSARVAELEGERAAAQGFAAVAAHELLKPLVMTEAYVAMASDSLDRDRHADNLRDLQTLGRAAARTRLLIQALLHDAYARERSLQRRQVDLGEVVQGCLSLLAPELQARQARVALEALPKVSGEASLLGCVFANLLLNALRYGPGQRTTIRVSARRRIATWELAVDSGGPTIPPADRQRIFQPFHRGTDERPASGFGLGLAICRNIVERHGGRIGVRPVGRSGNRFYFTLPDVEALAV